MYHLIKTNPLICPTSQPTYLPTRLPTYPLRPCSLGKAALRARNTMHNRVVADAFIPAGGRPSTIHEGNWRQFLQPSTGEPSARLVVEGANLFITPGAREKLFEECALPIVKDSSANKCGVICSSYEIASSMLLDEGEFLSHKESIVEDVLVRLRSLGQREVRNQRRNKRDSETNNTAALLLFFSSIHHSTHLVSFPGMLLLYLHS